MKYDFAALRFYNDKNICDRVYWYLSDFPLSVGEKVLAPLGVRGKLQAAVVEKTVSSDRDNAPYDIELAKHVVCRVGERRLFADGVECLELGGVRYDEKHYTPFGRVMLAKDKPEQTKELKLYGVEKVLPCEGNLIPYEEIASAKGCVLLCGARGRVAFEALLALARGDSEPLLAAGADERTILRLKEKLQ